MRAQVFLLIIVVSVLAASCQGRMKSSAEYGLDKAIAEKSGYNSLKEQRLHEFKIMKNSLGGGRP